MNTEIISEVCGYEKKKGDFHKEATVHLKKHRPSPLLLTKDLSGHTLKSHHYKSEIVLNY